MLREQLLSILKPCKNWKSNINSPNTICFKLEQMVFKTRNICLRSGEFIEAKKVTSSSSKTKCSEVLWKKLEKLKMSIIELIVYFINAV